MKWLLAAILVIKVIWIPNFSGGPLDYLFQWTPWPPRLSKLFSALRRLLPCKHSMWGNILSTTTAAAGQSIGDGFTKCWNRIPIPHYHIVVLIIITIIIVVLIIIINTIIVILNYHNSPLSSFDHFPNDPPKSSRSHEANIKTENSQLIHCYCLQQWA